MPPPFVIDRGGRTDLPAVYALLEACGMPTDGLADDAQHLLLARNGDRLLGTAAIEMYADAALLRSVAVAEGSRGRGLGHRLTDTALELAREHGAAHAYLLTTTADTYFERRGFRRIARSEVPDGVKQSAEFVSACPASATVMVLELTRNA